MKRILVVVLLILFTFPVQAVCWSNAAPFLRDRLPGPNGNGYIVCVEDLVAEQDELLDSLVDIAPDNRMNFQNGDHIAVVYQTSVEVLVYYPDGQIAIRFYYFAILPVCTEDFLICAYWRNAEEYQINLIDYEYKLYEVILERYS